MSMKAHAILLGAACVVSGCQGTPATGVAGQPVYQPPAGYTAQPVSTPPTGVAAAGQAPPALDRNGNPNYDANGTYVGGHGIGTLVDSPENKDGIPTVSVPSVSAPSLSGMKCTGSSAANAGTLDCTN
jgi:hypothetical protein